MKIKHILALFLTICLVCLSVCVFASLTDGLAAWWDFSEGKGDILKDKSGNGNDGIIKNAQWITKGPYKGLSFNGVDSVVDCGDKPSLNLAGDYTISVLIKCAGPQWSGEAGILGKAYGSYVITSYRDLIYAYMGGGGNNISVSMPVGSWTYLTVTYNEKEMNFFINGKLSKVQLSKPRDPSFKAGGKFWIGRSDGEYLWTKDAHFKGDISEIRVYNRVLSDDELKQLTKLKEILSPDIKAIAVPFQNKICIASKQASKKYVDYIRMKITDPISKKVIASKNVYADSSLQSEFSITNLKLKPGKYVLNAVQIGKNGGEFGEPIDVDINWFALNNNTIDAKGNKKLNNLVTELLKVEKDESGKSYSFENPKNGWIYISNKSSDSVEIVKPNGEKLQIMLDTKYKGANECMFELPVGKYKISTQSANNLIVRSIVEIIYSQYGSNPIIKEFGPFAGNFEKKLYKNVNAIMSGFTNTNDPFMAQWRNMGRKWILHSTAPKGTSEKPLTAQEVYDFVSTTTGFTLPYVSGNFADEFGGSEPVCKSYAEAIRMLKKNPKFKDRAFYPFGGYLYDGPDGIDMMKAVIECGGKLGLEVYLQEKRTETEAWEMLFNRLVDPIVQFREKVPGSVPHISIVYGIFDAPNETLDTLPFINQKTFLDMQFNIVANHPDNYDIGSLMIYLSSYCSDEMLKWSTELFRHYCIEGKTDMLTDDPYYLNHTINADFEDGLAGWKVSPAEKNSIRMDYSPGFGWLEGRYPTVPEGDSVLITKRSDKKPNVFAQTIKNLKPGKFYSLEFYIGDFKDMEQKQKFASSFKIDGVDIIKEKSFVSEFGSCYSHIFGKYNAEKPAYMNYIFYVFKAKSPTAKLTVTDWESQTNPGGPIGQEQMYNFFQVQPYFMGEE